MHMQTDKLTFHTDNRDGATVVHIAGELDLEVASQMRAAMEPLMRQDRRLVLNLRDLKYIDSTGIGILIGVLKARHARSAPFSVEEVPDSIRKLFDMTGISPFLAAAEQTGREMTGPTHNQ
jgi:anti-sigma B factor antagonist